MMNAARNMPTTVPKHILQGASTRENRYPVERDSSDSYAPPSRVVQPLPDEALLHRYGAFLSRMAVRIQDRIILLNSRDITWIQSKGNWICLHSQAGDYDHRMTMAELEMQLDPNIFLRVHRNAIVNMVHVSEFTLPRTGNAFVHLRNGKALPISRARRYEVRRYLRSSSRLD